MGVDWELHAASIVSVDVGDVVGDYNKIKRKLSAVHLAGVAMFSLRFPALALDIVLAWFSAGSIVVLELANFEIFGGVLSSYSPAMMLSSMSTNGRNSKSVSS